MIHDTIEYPPPISGTTEQEILKTGSLLFFAPTWGRKEEPHLPCPHHDVKIIQRSKGQSAVASAAYQSGERLFSEYDQKQKYYSHKSEIVHMEIMRHRGLER